MNNHNFSNIKKVEKDRGEREEGGGRGKEWKNIKQSKLIKIKVKEKLQVQVSEIYIFNRKNNGIR